MSEAPLLDEGIEDLSVEEHLEERPLHRGAVLEEQLLVEQVRDVPGSLRGSGHQGNQTLPREIRNTIGCTQGVTVLGGGGGGGGGLTCSDQSWMQKTSRRLP